MTVPADSASEWLERESAKLRAARAANPGCSIFFPDLGDAAARRQIVRWMGSEYDAPTPGILETLRTALDDPDWEVRASAMIVASRLHAVELRTAVRDADLPSAGQFGLNESDVQLLIAMRFVAGELLGASLDPRKAEAIVAEDFSILRHDLAALARRDTPAPVTGRELFIHSLVTPAEICDEPPDVLPTGIVERDNGVWLDGTDVSMVWIGPGVYLLGGDVTPGSDTTEVRHYNLQRGFFISRRPLLASDIAHCGIAPPIEDSVPPVVNKRLRMMNDPPIMLSLNHAAMLCLEISIARSATVSLPTADQLECAARGMDGRRFCWGNGMQRVNGREKSATGLERFAAPVAQWTSNSHSSRGAVVAGGPESPSCAARITVNGDTRAALRIVIQED